MIHGSFCCEVWMGSYSWRVLSLKLTGRGKERREGKPTQTNTRKTNPPSLGRSVACSITIFTSLQPHLCLLYPLLYPPRFFHPTGIDSNRDFVDGSVFPVLYATLLAKYTPLSNRFRSFHPPLLPLSPYSYSLTSALITPSALKRAPSPCLLELQCPIPNVLGSRLISSSQ